MHLKTNHTSPSGGAIVAVIYDQPKPPPRVAKSSTYTTQQIRVLIFTTTVKSEHLLPQLISPVALHGPRLVASKDFSVFFKIETKFPKTLMYGNQNFSAS